MKFINLVKRKILPLRFKIKKLGSNVVIGKRVVMYGEENIEIGNNVYIGDFGRYEGYGGLRIGDGSILAHNIEIITRNHNYDSDDLQSIPYDRKYIYKPVIIHENVWICTGVKITPGVTINEGAVIGMGAVITKDIPPLAVVGGNPSRILKYRDAGIYYKLKREKEIYLNEKSKK